MRAVACQNGQLDVVEAYDPVTNSWTLKAPAPTRRTDGVAGAINGIIYVAGGYNGTVAVPTVEAYDPVSNTWSTKAPLPTPRLLSVGVVSGGKFYVIGGYVLPSTPKSLVEIYTP